MLFNSFPFLLLFWPLCLISFYLIAGKNQKIGIPHLIIASLIFYGVWNPPYLLLLIGSVLFNFNFGKLLRSKPSIKLLSLGVTVNLASIAYFKYAGFLLGNIEALTPFDMPATNIILPLGISFFTFQQISYLIETYRGEIKDNDFARYALFVTFFPQLIAGPIVRYHEIAEQFSKKDFGKFKWPGVSAGLTIFCIGLSKKVVLADTLAQIASPVFAQADAGFTVTMIEAWLATFAYSFQIYFDFSGYSDMAIGLGLMLGLRLPDNFRSPYKATNIIDFWRFWHMTLSRFLRDYLYYPLGGNRLGKVRRYLNLSIVMLLGGLWHGASWNFVIWGGLHGFYLMVNHGWRALFHRDTTALSAETNHNYIGMIITFMAVSVAWVFFRAESFDGALMMLSAMSGQDAAALTAGTFKQSLSLFALAILPCLFLVWFTPNSLEILSKTEKQLGSGVISGKKAIAAGGILGLSLFIIFTGSYSEFIYFQF